MRLLKLIFSVFTVAGTYSSSFGADILVLKNGTPLECNVRGLLAGTVRSILLQRGEKIALRDSRASYVGITPQQIRAGSESIVLSNDSTFSND